MNREIKSKTKKELSRIKSKFKGEADIGEELYKRQGVTHFRRIYEVDSPTLVWEITHNQKKYGEDHIKALAERAAVWLKDNNLPCEGTVFYRPAERLRIGDIITKEEAVGKEKYGISSLTNFMEKIGYRRQDYEYLMAEIIISAHQILVPGSKTDTIIDSALRMGRILERVEILSRGDKQTGGKRKSKGLQFYINRALDALGDKATNKDIYIWLQKEGIIGRVTGEYISVNGGKNIKRISYRPMVSKVKKARKQTGE